MRPTLRKLPILQAASNNTVRRTASQKFREEKVLMESLGTCGDKNSILLYSWIYHISRSIYTILYLRVVDILNKMKFLLHLDALGGLQSFESHYSEFVEKPEPHEQPKLLFSPTTPDNFNEDIDTAVISEVIPGFLFIGNERDASNWTRLQEVGITHVLNVTAHIPLYFADRGIQYHRLPASDSCNQNLKQYFTDAIKFLDDVRSSGGKALVHCQAGVSRSATITIAYVMRHSTLNTMDAYRFVKSKRHIVNPNLNFMGQLIGFDTQLDGGEISRTCDLDLGEISVPAE